MISCEPAIRRPAMAWEALRCHMHSSVVKEHGSWVNAKRPTRVICAGGALWLPSGPMCGTYEPRRMVLPCAFLVSKPPTCFRSDGLSMRAKPSRAYTSPLTA